MKIVNVSGKRKRAIARARIKEGRGIVKINNLVLEQYQPKLARDRILEPIKLAGDLSKKVDIRINVKGGGWNSQAEAVRLTIAKGLVEFSGDKNLKQLYLGYDRHLLIQDSRAKEMCKPNDSKARAKRQKSYR